MAKLKQLKELTPEGEPVYTVRQYPTIKITRRELLVDKEMAEREMRRLRERLDDINEQLAQMDELEN